MLDIEWRETVSKIRSSDTLKNVFIADGLLLGKVIPKVFFINVRDRVMRRKKNMDIHFQKCQKILCQTLGIFCLGFEVWFLIQFPGCPMEMWVWFFFILYYLCIHTKIEKVCSGMWSQARVVFRGIQGIWVEKEVFQCCVTFHPNN